MNCPHCGVHIDEHEASRCLDAWVAESVMDEILIGPDTVSPHDADTGITNDVSLGLSFYSTDIAAAWEVVEKLSADGHGCNILKHSDPRGDCLCEFWHTKAIDLGRWCSNHQPTVPLAICRAAIKAKGDSR